MSELIKQVKAHQTNVRKAVIEPLSNYLKIDDGFHSVNSKTASKYRIDVTLGCDVFIQEGPHMTRHCERAIQDVRYQLVQAIFGEFRSDIHNITRLAYNFDCDGVIDAVKALELKMFEV